MLTNIPRYVAYVNKGIIQVIGFAGGVLSLGLLPHPYDLWVTAAIGFLTMVTHFLTPNADAPGAAVADDVNVVEEPEVEDDWQPAPLVTVSQVQQKTGVASSSPPPPPLPPAPATTPASS